MRNGSRLEFCLLLRLQQPVVLVDARHPWVVLVRSLKHLLPHLLLRLRSDRADAAREDRKWCRLEINRVLRKVRSHCLYDIVYFSFSNSCPLFKGARPRQCVSYHDMQTSPVMTESRSSIRQSMPIAEMEENTDIAKSSCTLLSYSLRLKFCIKNDCFVLINLFSRS